MAQAKCPICKERPPEHRSVKPYVLKNGTIVLAGDYGVCDPCHIEQYRDVYGFTPKEAPSKAPPDDPFAGEYK